MWLVNSSPQVFRAVQDNQLGTCITTILVSMQERKD